jgi:FdhD protein
MATESRLSAALRQVDVSRLSASRVEQVHDVAAAEEPLEIRLHGNPFVVIMRTPGADRDLVAGFLFAERIIRSADDLGIVRHCVDPNGAQAPNVVDVRLAGEAEAALDTTLAARRAVTAASACGVCGRQTIDDLMSGVEPVRARWHVGAPLIHSLSATLRAAQAAFAATGGLHAAGLFARDGVLVRSAEDVGRHNTVDKVVGAELFMERLPLDERLLFVSGRAGYEIVQKALVARIPVVASVSAPSSLAIELAREGGITLLGFVRDGSFNIYTGAERIDVS